MCGIVGYIGDHQAQDVLMYGLSKLEYRGYDSAGIAVLDQCQKINITKKKGRIKNLEEALEKKGLTGSIGIGHTRWATHGEPSDINAHPHASIDKKIAVVHNGIIENYMELKEELIKAGHLFVSDTDTEVIAHLLRNMYNGDIVDTVQRAIKKLRGSYALGVLCAEEPDKIIAVRKDSPLIVGLGEHENYIASDIPAILKYTRDVYLLDNGEIAILTKDKIDVIDQYGNSAGKQVFKVDWDLGDAEKGGFDHFMLKEIYEQPRALKNSISGRSFADHILLDEIKITAEDLNKITRINIVACGTAYHAGMIGKYYIEKFARITVETEAASEYRYKDPLLDDKTLLIVISQSGETADTLAALRLAKEKGARIIAITNVVGSSIAREADEVLYTNAGPEIAVASTKAYVTQVTCLTMLAMHLGQLKETFNSEEMQAMHQGLVAMPDMVQNILDDQDGIKDFAYHNFKIKDLYYIGRGLDYYTCLEGALKSKEVSYIHSDAYIAGELKHGSIALIEPGTILIAVCTQENIYEKMLSNIKEVKARGAIVLAITQEKHQEILSEVDHAIFIPNMNDQLTPIPTTVYLQLLGYYLAVARGCDVDKPKNLAKSVTVE